LDLGRVGRNEDDRPAGLILIVHVGELATEIVHPPADGIE
jgi:hypothetical protein